MRAFTLIELLVVIAIIAILTALLFPVLARAKESANKATAISNMRQCVQGATMYYDENGHFPNLTIARKIIPRSVTYDPNDYWRKDSSEDWPYMLGSFGYPFRAERDDEGLMMNFTGKPSVPVVASIFYEQPQIHSFKGDSPAEDPAAKSYSVPLPYQALVGWSDGSVKVRKVRHIVESDGSKQGFTWSSFFIGLSLTEQKP